MNSTRVLATASVISLGLSVSEKWDYRCSLRRALTHQREPAQPGVA